ncbi:MAG: hypothetical protein HOP29_00480 [Phycisphaerales bacterium]|nr:hypothetical protein [Phycisphaerales bacterium]
MDHPLHAHSLAEIHLYFMATRCPDCGHGPLRSLPDQPAPPINPFDVTAECAACRHRHTLRFSVPHRESRDEASHLYAVVNPTDEPSRILDVGQWIVLFRVVLEAAEKEPRKIEARRLGYEAAQCLEEAIKFYGDGDVPPASAVFTDATRAHLREQPDQYSRKRLIDMRAKLPTLATLQKRFGQSSNAGKRPWWRFWSPRK